MPAILTLICKCGREYRGKNDKLVHKLLQLHVKTKHNMTIDEKHIDIYESGIYNESTMKHYTQNTTEREYMNVVNTARSIC